MGASHFFVGLGAGIAILTVPALTLVPGMDLPHRFATWIDGGSVNTARTAATDLVAVSRPRSGYKPGDPTPAPETPPTIAPVVAPTVAPRAQPQVVVQPPPGSTTRTGVVRGNGTPVFVRKVAGIESTDDPVLADGSPVLVSVGSGLQVAGQPWRAIRGLNGVVGWVPSAQVAVDGEARLAAPTPAAIQVGLTPAAPNAERLKIANTDGVGVVLRNSPRDTDRSRTGLVDGAVVSVVDRSGSDWVHVKADNGADGWVPARYVVPAL
jgi:SH3-like domain-containing protein